MCSDCLVVKGLQFPNVFGSCISRVSSIVTIWSFWGRKTVKAFMKLVFPHPVSPETKILNLFCIASHRNARTSTDTVLFFMRRTILHGFLEKTRISMSVVSPVTCGKETFTRSFVCSMASIRGCEASICWLVSRAIAFAYFLSFSHVMMIFVGSHSFFEPICLT